MSINQLQGGNNPNNTAHVDAGGRLQTSTVNTEEQEHAAANGDTYNIDTGVITLTTDAETPVLYLKNTGEARVIKLSRLSLTTLASTGGTGPVIASLHVNITGGTITTATPAPTKNFNVTSAKTLAVDARRGMTGGTFVSGAAEPTLRAMFPGAPVFAVAPYDHVVIPQGGSVCVVITPPTGNTSMVLLASLIAFLSESVTL